MFIIVILLVSRQRFLLASVTILVLDNVFECFPRGVEWLVGNDD
jgi:hypothetical protein